VNPKILAAGLLAVLPLLAVLFLNLGRDPHAIESPLIGRSAPPFSLSPAGGGPAISLESLRGRPVVINFWATWCVPCFQEHAVLVQGAKALAPGVQFVGIVYEDEEPRVLQFLDERGSAYPSLMDPEAKTAIAYGVAGVPETYFIDAAGSVVTKYVGPLNSRLLSALVDKSRGGT